MSPPPRPHPALIRGWRAAPAAFTVAWLSATAGPALAQDAAPATGPSSVAPIATPSPATPSPPTTPPGPIPTLRSVAEIWTKLRTPAVGPPLAIGATNAGCLQGARSLKPVGAGYRVLHLQRHRYFGHPTLVAFVQRLATSAHKLKLGPLMIGDLSQARGGPAPTGHRSHQTGLDVDIGYTPAPRLPPGADPENLTFADVVDVHTNQMLPTWTPRVRRLVEQAASDPIVDRIFVHPAIKRRICAEVPHTAPWVRRLRPWWGHQDHFHVRLRCPDGNSGCQPQDPLPDDDGCAALTWWFSEDARSSQAQRQRTEAQAPPPFVLPAACNALAATTPAGHK